jgi:hypothetical protein
VRPIGGTDVQWAQGNDGEHSWVAAYWTRDELVVHVGGEDVREIEAAISRLL